MGAASCASACSQWRASAFLLQVAAARFGRLGSMGLRLLGLAVVALEIGENLPLADKRRALLGQQGRHGVRAAQGEQDRSLLPLDRHLVVEVVEPELGQPLADPPCSGTPFGLEQLEHDESLRAPATTWPSDSSCRSRLPQT